MKNTANFIRIIDRVPLFVSSFAVLALLLLLTLMPADEAPRADLFPNADKLSHAIMFGGVSAVVLWDIARKNRILNVRMWLSIAWMVTLLGGLIEIAQDVMGLGRDGDWWDWGADMVGAFVLPIVLWPLIGTAVRVYVLDLYTFSVKDSIPVWVKELYIKSFPPEERREWDKVTLKMCDAASPFHVTLIESAMNPVGFISWWKLDNIVYVEHFAIDPDMRGGGIGALAIKRFVAGVAVPVVLEVELPESNGMAARRIAFYERCGFMPHPEFGYIQPPYAPGLPEVPLMLMTSAAPDCGLEKAAALIHVNVYGKHS